MIIDGVTITGGVFIESAGAVPVDNDFAFTLTTIDNTGYAELYLNEDLSLANVGGNIYWGDGNVTSYDDQGYLDFTYTYDTAGTYQVKITGLCRWLSVYNDNPTVSIDNFGNIGLQKLTVNLIDANYAVPNTLPSSLNSISFVQSFNFNDANVVGWNTSNLTSMESMFNNCTAFNQPIGNWDVGNVTSMRSMFQGCSAFNQDIGNWDVGNVTDMYFMFQTCTAFNQDIGNWDVGNVTNMQAMFGGTSAFNQDLTGWCVTNIATEPTSFAADSALDANNYPVWGTCP